MAGAVVQAMADAEMIEDALAALPYVKNPQYRETLKAAGRIYAKGDPPDELNVARQLESVNLPPPKDGWHAGLTNPLSDMVTPGQVRQAIGELREMDFEDSVDRVLQEPNGDRPLVERLQVLIDAQGERQPLSIPEGHTPEEAARLPRPRPMLRIAGESGAVLPEGEAAVCSAGGGSGKSCLALTIAIGASPKLTIRRTVRKKVHRLPDEQIEHWHAGESCGFEVRTGPVLYLGAEDKPGKLGPLVLHIARTLYPHENPEELTEHITIYDARAAGPLFAPKVDGALTNHLPAPTDHWHAVWDQHVDRLAQQHGTAPLVVIDPKSAVVRGDLNSPAVPAIFYDAIAEQIDQLEDSTGVLLVDHPPKAGRRRLDGRGQQVTIDDVDRIAGNDQWFNKARGAFFLQADRKRENAELRIFKANDGPWPRTIHLVNESPDWYPAWRLQSQAEADEREAEELAAQPQGPKRQLERKAHLEEVLALVTKWQADNPDVREVMPGTVADSINADRPIHEKIDARSIGTHLKHLGWKRTSKNTPYHRPA